MTHPANLRRQQLREQRTHELVDSCKDEVLKQIIGPFGLTPTMFQDKTGGNVTSLHNFNKGVVATKKDQDRYNQFKYNVENPINRDPYESSFPSKRKEIFQRDEPIISPYTGNELPRDGRTHLDHVTPVEKIERDPATDLFMSKEERVEMANKKENLVPAESNINLSMQDRDKEEWAKRPSSKDSTKTNAEANDIDMDNLKKTNKESERHINGEVLKSQVKKQGTKLAITGLQEAAKNAVRQAMGQLLYELVRGAYEEISRLMTTPEVQDRFIDELIASLKTVATRVQQKMTAVFNALVTGGVEGFVSNLLTFIINNVVTSSAKVVTVIREGIKGLWEAIVLAGEAARRYEWHRGGAASHEAHCRSDYHQPGDARREIHRGCHPRYPAAGAAVTDYRTGNHSDCDRHHDRCSCLRH